MYQPHRVAIELIRPATPWHVASAQYVSGSGAETGRLRGPARSKWRRWGLSNEHGGVAHRKQKQTEVSEGRKQRTEQEPALDTPPHLTHLGPESLAVSCTLLEPSVPPSGADTHQASQGYLPGARPSLHRALRGQRARNQEEHLAWDTETVQPQLTRWAAPQMTSRRILGRRLAQPEC